MNPTNPVCLVIAYKTHTACCSFHLNAVALQKSPHSATFQAQVNGTGKVGNGIHEQIYGHIGPIYQMPAKDAHCYSTLGAWLHAKTTASAIELEFAVHCTNNDMTIRSEFVLRTS
jgi:hypothetical protein